MVGGVFSQTRVGVFSVAHTDIWRTSTLPSVCAMLSAILPPWSADRTADGGDKMAE